MPTARSTFSLIGDAVAQASDLLRAEQHLFRAEIDEKISRARMALVLAVAAAILLFAALLVLLGAAVDWITALGLQRFWAGLIVGGIVALIGLLLIAKAVSDLKRVKPGRWRSLIQLRSAFGVKGEAK